MDLALVSVAVPYLRDGSQRPPSKLVVFTQLVGSTHEDGVPASQAAVARVNICRQHGADQVAQVGAVVDVGQGRSDENVPGTLRGLVSGWRSRRTGRRSVPHAEAEALSARETQWGNRERKKKRSSPHPQYCWPLAVPRNAERPWLRETL